MSKLKTTPGPWFAEHSSVIGLDDEIVTTCVVGSVYRGDDAEDYATAHLIAAAPDLYDALQNLLSRLANDADGHAWFMDEQEASIIALAKARGET